MNAIQQIHASICTHPVAFSIERWIEIREVLLPAVALLGGTHNEVDMVAMLLAGRMQLWISGRSAMITEIITYPRLKRLSVFAAGGDLDQIMSLKESLEDFAKENGCRQARIEGRHGWERMHPDYRFLSVALIKEL